MRLQVQERIAIIISGIGAILIFSQIILNPNHQVNLRLFLFEYGFILIIMAVLFGFSPGPDYRSGGFIGPDPAYIRNIDEKQRKFTGHMDNTQMVLLIMAIICIVISIFL
jgi:hypothetical protein